MTRTGIRPLSTRLLALAAAALLAISGVIYYGTRSASAAPKDPGFTTLFDGTATGTPHSLDKWLQVGAGNMVLQPDGSLMTNGGLGMLWFPGEEFGNAVFRVDYKDPQP